MFTPAKFAVLLTAVLSVAAIPSHIARNPHNHREIAARVAQPEVGSVAYVTARDMAVPAQRMRRRKRADTDRCQSENGSGVPSSTIKEDPKPSSTDPATPDVSPVPKQQNGRPNSSPPADTSTSSPPEGTSTGSPPEDTSTTPKEDPTSTPTTTKQPDPATPTPTPTSTPTTSSTGATHTGQGTFYGTGLGACGITNNDSQDVAAVAHSFFDSFPGYNGGNPNTNPLCGKTAKVTYQGKTISVTLTDRCTGCANDDLDFSPHAFNQLADPSVGRIDGIVWEITD